MFPIWTVNPTWPHNLRNCFTVVGVLLIPVSSYGCSHINTKYLSTTEHSVVCSTSLVVQSTVLVQLFLTMGGGWVFHVTIVCWSPQSLVTLHFISVLLYSTSPSEEDTEEETEEEEEEEEEETSD